MRDWHDIFNEKLLSVEDAAGLVHSGDRIFAGGSGSFPAALIDAVCAREELRDIKIISAVNGTDCRALTDPSCFDRVEYNSLFLGSADRRAQKLGNICYNSVQFHQAIDAVVEVYGANVLMLEVAEPDDEGYLYYSPRGGVAWGILDEHIQTVILQINKYQQRVGGYHTKVHISDVAGVCRCDHPLRTYQYKYSADTDERIASHIIPFIQDGDTLQVGIGGIPNAVAYGAKARKNLGIYTEVLTDAQLELMREGCVDPDRVEASFTLDSEAHIDDELLRHIRMSPLNRLNDPVRAAAQPGLISVNACLMADLTGQVCSEAVGTRHYSGVGGQLDFVRAAAHSRGGKSFLCLKSTHTDSSGKVTSSIHAQLPAGAVVTTPRSDVMYLVTEWGAALLHNRPFPDRAVAVINIAHPDFRKALAEEAIGLGLLTRKRAQKDIIFNPEEAK